MRMLGTFSKNIIPNGGLMVIYHGTIHKKSPYTNPRETCLFLPYLVLNSLGTLTCLFWGVQKNTDSKNCVHFFSPNNKWDLQTNRLPSQKPFEKLRNHHYLVVSTTLEKYASQIGSFPQEGVKINNIPPRSSTRVFNLQWLFSWFPRPSRPKFVQLGISSLNIFWVFFGSANG